MKVKIYLKVNSPELAKAIDIDNLTAPKDMKIKTYFKKGYLVTSIEAKDIGSIVNVVDEILELIKLKEIEKVLK